MNHVELFAGCGGMSLGLSAAGFDTLMANELSPMAAETYAYNLLESDLSTGDLFDDVIWLDSIHPRGEQIKRLRENPQGEKHGENIAIYNDAVQGNGHKLFPKKTLLVACIKKVNAQLKSKKLF